MTADTILFIIIAAVIALVLAVFMYGFRSPYSKNLRWTFGLLRFISVFALLLLLINPKLKSETYTTVKPKLPVLVDNSVSINELEQDENSNELVRQFKEHPQLNERFELSFYSFGTGLDPLDSLTFTDNNTNITKAFQGMRNLYDDAIAPTVMITDGNQTLGTDYEFALSTYKHPVYPIILGDSITYTDLRIEQLNVNRYAFLKNEFPVEVIAVYSGSGVANTQFRIRQGNAVLYNTPVSFSETDNLRTFNVTLTAAEVGVQQFTAEIIPLSDEKNTVNNTKRFAVEVIDQATNVLLVSKILHPDIGALQKSITSNEQRSLTLVKPSEAISRLNDHQLILLYQPDRSFAPLFSEIAKLKKNSLYVTGTSTDWNFLNGAQDLFNKNATGQTEEVSGRVNPNFGAFAVPDIGLESFSPLETAFGSLSITVPHDVLIEQSVDNILTDDALLATTDIDGIRNAIWDGEGIWKWRAQSYLKEESFETFDNFMGTLIQFLASSKRRSRLEVNHESFYYNNAPVRITAQYFDNNFVFDPRASLNITVMHSESGERTVLPLLLRNNYFEVDLNRLNEGDYTFTVSVSNGEVSRSGEFTILDYNVEQQFLNANIKKLHALADNTDGKAYYFGESEALINALLKDDRFRSIQKSQQNVVPLVDWKYLLFIIAASLAAEWFIRKYNGLI